VPASSANVAPLSLHLADSTARQNYLRYMAFWLSTRHLNLSPQSLGALLPSSWRHRAPASTRPKTTYTSPNMPLHISDGQDKAQINEEVEVLREQNWNLERESVLVKTYHFKTYTKVTVRELFELYDSS
jgi:hypothetical protein